jgi:hypothetical protein
VALAERSYRRIHEAPELLESRWVGPARPSDEQHTWRLVEQELTNAGASAYWDTPLQPGEPRRSLRAGARLRLSEGAELICRRGAGRCLQCSAALPARTVRTTAGPRPRTARVVYCGPCDRALIEAKGEGRGDAQAKHRDAIHLTLTLAAESLLGDARARRRRQRRAAARTQAAALTR